MSVNKYTATDGKTKWYFSVRYKDWTGTQKRKKAEGFRTQREAKEAETKFLNSCRTDVAIPFETLVDAYMEDCKAHVAQTTFATKKHIIETKILPYFANLPLNSIDTITIRKWQNELIRNDNQYKDTYLKTINNQLSAIFNFAVKYYNLKSNPARLCGSMGKKKADTMQFWTVSEFKQFIEATKDNAIAFTIFNLLFYSGIREGELLALALNDFDLDNKTVSVTKSFSVVGGEQIIKEPKTPKSKRTVTLPAQIIEYVKSYANSLYGYEPHERLFPVTKHALVKFMSKYAALSGVKRIRIHDIRHSHASMLIHMGVSPIQISERLGHEDIQTTLGTYSHLYPNKQEELAEALDKIIKN